MNLGQGAFLFFVLLSLDLPPNSQLSRRKTSRNLVFDTEIYHPLPSKAGEKRVEYVRAEEWLATNECLSNNSARPGKSFCFLVDEQGYMKSLGLVTYSKAIPPADFVLKIRAIREEIHSKLVHLEEPPWRIHFLEEDSVFLSLLSFSGISEEPETAQTSLWYYRVEGKKSALTSFHLAVSLQVEEAKKKEYRHYIRQRMTAWEKELIALHLAVN